MHAVAWQGQQIHGRAAVRADGCGDGGGAVCAAGAVRGDGGGRGDRARLPCVMLRRAARAQRRRRCGGWQRQLHVQCIAWQLWAALGPRGGRRWRRGRAGGVAVCRPDVYVARARVRHARGTPNGGEKPSCAGPGPAQVFLCIVLMLWWRSRERMHGGGGGSARSIGVRSVAGRRRAPVAVRGRERGRGRGSTVQL